MFPNPTYYNPNQQQGTNNPNAAAIQNQFQMTQNALQNNAAVAAGSTPTYYQVKEDDRSVEDVAYMTGVPLQVLTELNKTKTLPPKGSYMQLKPENLVNQGMPSTVAAQLTGNPLRPPQNNFGEDSATRRATHAIQLQANQISTQLQNGQLPSSIPANALSLIRDNQGNPVTIQDFLAEGYVLNDKGVLVRGGTAGAPANGVSPEYAATKAYSLGLNVDGSLNMNALRWDPTTRKYVSIRKLVKQGKLNMKTGRSQRPTNKHGKPKGNRNNAPAPIAVPTTREGPETALDIHLGSG